MFNKLFIRGLGLTLLLVVLLTIQPWESPLFAQTNTPVPPPPKPLPFNQTLSGQLRGKGEKVSFTFEVPIDQDVIFVYRTSKLVFSGYCIVSDTAPASDDQCESEGGSGGDRPINSLRMIATLGQAGQKATVTLTRILDGASTYQVTAYPVTPQAINLDETNTFKPIDSEPYQVYTIDADPSEPFTVEVEDEAADGNFLWAAYQPYIYQTFPNFEKLLFNSKYIDGAISENGAAGASRLTLYYLGGRTFHVLVQSTKSYILHAANAEVPILDKNRKIKMSVSYRQPIMVARLNVAGGEQAKVNFNVTAGTGAIVRVYEAGNPVDDGKSLGDAGANGSAFALSSDIQRTAVAVQGLFIVVQLPFEYTRGTVDVEVIWQGLN